MMNRKGSCQVSNFYNTRENVERSQNANKKPAPTTNRTERKDMSRYEDKSVKRIQR